MAIIRNQISDHHIENDVTEGNEREYHTHICVAQGWKFNILVAQCYTCMIKQVPVLNSVKLF